jgi:hypothetical protein
MPTASAFLRKQASSIDGEPLFTEDEVLRIEAMSDQELESHIAGLAKAIDDIEFRKRMRMNAREYRETRSFETEDIEGDTDRGTVKLAASSIVIDRVPPKVRREIAQREMSE